MTIWLTDNRETAQAFVPDELTWDESGGHSPSVGFAPGFFSGDVYWLSGSGGPLERTVILVDEAPGSQFDRVLDLMRNGVGLPDRMVCLALTGKGFRGQRSRPWAATRGNLHLTSLHRLDLPMEPIRAALTMLPAVAAAETIGGLLGDDDSPRIKWVNDVLLDGNKVAGVLTATTVSGARVDHAVFGIGINVRTTPRIGASPFVPAATCLADHDASLASALPRVFDEVTRRLDQWVSTLQADGGDAIFERYAALSGFVGREVRIFPEDTESTAGVTAIAEGRVVSLNRDLSLNIAGVSVPVRMGRMAFREHC